MPYIFHPILAAWLVWKYGNLLGEARVKAMIVALLHDVLEDTRATYTELKWVFGMEIADAVVALSHNKAIKQRGCSKREVLDEKLARLALYPEWVRIVEPCGRFANILEPGDWTPEELRIYVENSIYGYDRLGVDAPKLFTRLNQELNAVHDLISALRAYKP